MMLTRRSQVIAGITLVMIVFAFAAAAWQPALASRSALLTATPTAIVITEPAPSDPPVVTGSINVSGSAQVMVAPDEVVLLLGIETHDLDLTIAKQQNDEVVKRVLELTKKYTIDPKYVQTDYINIEPRYESSYERKENFLGYFVRKNIEVRLHDVSMFEDFYSDVLAMGVTHVHGIEFRTTELRKYRDQARELALKAAREKAEDMAAVYGQKVGEVKTVQETSTNWWGSYNSWWGSSGGMMLQNVVQNAGPGSSFNEDETLAPGQIAVSANVTVEFTLIK